MSHAVTPDAPDPTRSYHRLTTPVDGLIAALSQKIGRGKAKEVERFIKFAFVGTLGFVIDIGAVIILQNTLLPPENDQNVLLANSIAFVLAVCSNFIWNRVWTYPDSRSYSVRRQLTQFAIVSVIGLVIRNVWINGTYEQSRATVNHNSEERVFRLCAAIDRPEQAGHNDCLGISVC